MSLHRQKILPNDWRSHLAAKPLQALEDEADPSVFETGFVETVLTEAEMQQAVVLARDKVLTNIPH